MLSESLVAGVPLTAHPPEAERPQAALQYSRPRPPAAGQRRAGRRGPRQAAVGLAVLRNGQGARHGACPAGPSSDLPLVTRRAVSLADKGALIVACPRPSPPHGQSLYITKLCKPVTGLSTGRLRAGCPRCPLTGAPPWPAGPTSSRRSRSRRRPLARLCRERPGAPCRARSRSRPRRPPGGLAGQAAARPAGGLPLLAAKPAAVTPSPSPALETRRHTPVSRRLQRRRRVLPVPRTEAVTGLPAPSR